MVQPTARAQARISPLALIAGWRTWLPPLIVAAVATAAALHYVRAMGWLRPVFDDSYISLTFARNLAEHGKLTFDGQHWSTGATSLVHVASVAVLIRIGVEPFSALIGFGVFCHVLLALAVYWLALVTFRSRVAAFSAGVLISVLNYAAYDAGNGMETTLFMALVAAAMAAVIGLEGRRGRATGGVLIALAVLTRPEGVLLIPSAAIYLAVNRTSRVTKRQLVGEVLILSAPAVFGLAAQSLYALAVTGTLSPGTATVKLRFFHEYDEPLAMKLNTAADFIGLFAGPIVVPLAFAALAARRRESLLFGLFLGPLYATYVLLLPGGLSHYFYRYQHPVLPIVAVLAAGSVAYLVEEAGRKDLAVKALAAVALVVLVVPVATYYQYWHRLYRDSAFETFVDLEGMAQDLNTIVRPDQVLATHDIGAAGYFAKYRVLDLVGLVNPEVVRFHAGRRIDRYIQVARPDYLLIFPDWDYEYLHLHPGDHPEMYELVKVYPGRNIRPQPYLLYRVHYDVAPQ
jgi:arabinofuranosyltransferase